MNSCDNFQPHEELTLLSFTVAERSRIDASSVLSLADLCKQEPGKGYQKRVTSRSGKVILILVSAVNKLRPTLTSVYLVYKCAPPL